MRILKVFGISLFILSGLYSQTGPGEIKGSNRDSAKAEVDPGQSSSTPKSDVPVQNDSLKIGPPKIPINTIVNVKTKTDSNLVDSLNIPKQPNIAGGLKEGSKSKIPIPSDSSSVKKDSSKSWFRLYGGFQLGFELMDFGPLSKFEADLNQHIEDLRVKDSASNANLTDSTHSLIMGKGSVLQPYDKVMFTFPAGLFFGVSIAPNFDLMVATKSIFREQEAVLSYPAPDTLKLRPGSDTLPSPEYDTGYVADESVVRKYGMTSHFLGAGIKFYVPLEFLSVKPETQLFASYTAYWLLGGGEIYSSAGVQKLSTHKSPSGMELSLGIQVKHWKYLSILGNLSFNKFTIPVDFDWNDLVAQDISNSDDLEWKSLKFNFQFIISNDVFN